MGFDFRVSGDNDYECDTHFLIEKEITIQNTGGIVMTAVSSQRISKVQYGKYFILKHQCKIYLTVLQNKI